MWYQINPFYSTCDLCTRVQSNSGESCMQSKVRWCQQRKPDCSFHFSWDCSSHSKGVEQALFHTVAEEQWVYTAVFILIFLLLYLMGNSYKTDLHLSSLFKAADEFGIYNVKRASAFPRARYNVSRWHAGSHVQKGQCTFRLGLQPFCCASLGLLWAQPQPRLYVCTW